LRGSSEAGTARRCASLARDFLLPARKSRFARKPGKKPAMDSPWECMRRLTRNEKRASKMAKRASGVKDSQAVKPNAISRAEYVYYRMRLYHDRGMQDVSSDSIARKLRPATRGGGSYREKISSTGAARRLRHPRCRKTTQRGSASHDLYLNTYNTPVCTSTSGGTYTYEQALSCWACFPSWINAENSTRPLLSPITVAQHCRRRMQRRRARWCTHAAGESRSGEPGLYLRDVRIFINQAP